MHEFLAFLPLPYPPPTPPMFPTPSQIHDINRNCIRKDLSEPIILENYYEANIKHTTKANQTTITWENNDK